MLHILYLYCIVCVWVYLGDGNKYMYVLSEYAWGCPLVWGAVILRMNGMYICMYVCMDKCMIEHGILFLLMCM